MKKSCAVLAIAIWVGAFGFFTSPIFAAIEGTYTETSTSIERDSQGAVLNEAGDTRRDIPEDRNMVRVGNTNVIKAEDKDRYVSRVIAQMKKDTDGKLEKFESRIAQMEQKVEQMARDLAEEQARKLAAKKRIEKEKKQGA